MSTITDLLTLVRKNGGFISVRDLQRRTRKFPTAHAAEVALNELKSRGYGSWETRQAKKGRPVPVFVLEGSQVPEESPTDADNVLPPEEDLKVLRKNEAEKHALQKRLRLAEAKLQQSEGELSALKELYEAADEAYQKHGLHSNVVPPKMNIGVGHGRGSATAIICATDWHLEGKVDPGLVEGLNEFNLDVFQRRNKRLWHKSLFMAEFASNISKIDEYVLWLGGDLINGAIHEELEETNFLGPSEAIVYMQDAVADGIDFLLNTIKKPLVVVTNQGNHGRSTRRKRISTGYRHSWEYLAYCNLQRIYRKDPRVRFKITRGYHNILDVQGRRVRFSHGDAVKYYGGVGGITIPVKKKIANWNKSRSVDLDIFGHFHQFLHHWDFISVGCLCGYNEYAMEIAAEYQPPTQAIVVVDREYGVVTAAPLFLEPNSAANLPPTSDSTL